jgi:hypothetical protein
VATFAAAVAAAAGLLDDAAGDVGAGRWRWQFGLDVGRFHDPSTAFDPPGQPRVPALEPPYQPQASAGQGPLAQLRARTTAVPFQPRRELDLLLRWCREPAGPPPPGDAAGDGAEPLRIAVAEGVGGAGKTRLGAELAHRLAADRWHTGFLTSGPPEDARAWLVGLASPLLVVIDYAERWPTDTLRDLLQELATRRRRTAVLFTARARADWWAALDKALTEKGVPRAVFPQLRLDARPTDPLRLFNRAYRRFADHAEAVDDPPDPADGGRWTTLDLVMHAWLAARTQAMAPTSRDQLHAAIIDRELAHWADTIERRFADRPAQEGLRMAAAYISLLSPQPRQLAAVLRESGIDQHTRPGRGRRP